MKTAQELGQAALAVVSASHQGVGREVVAAVFDEAEAAEAMPDLCWVLAGLAASLTRPAGTGLGLDPDEVMRTIGGQLAGGAASMPLHPDPDMVREQARRHVTALVLAGETGDDVEGMITDLSRSGGGLRPLLVQALDDYAKALRRIGSAPA